MHVLGVRLKARNDTLQDALFTYAQPAISALQLPPAPEVELQTLVDAALTQH